MDGSASIGLEQALLGHSLGFAPMASPLQVYVSLCLASTVPSETVPGLEASGGGYARQPAIFALIAGPSNIAANTTSIEFPQALSSWGQIGFFELWDAPNGGNRLYWGQLVSTTDFTTPLVLQVSAGDITRFSAGTLGVQASTGAGGTASIGAYLPLAGGTLSGPLLLAADPTDYLQAATKQYVDAHSGSGGGPGFLALSGGTMLGQLTLAANATLPLQAVPLQQLSAAVAAGPFLPLSGGTVTGNVTTTGFLQAIGGITAGNNTATTAGAAIFVNSAPSVVRRFDLMTASSLRWRFGANGAAEAGSNAGSDFFVNAYSDAAGLLGTPLSIARATMQTSMVSARLGATFTYTGQASTPNNSALYVSANYSGSTDHSTWGYLNAFNINSDALDVGASQQAIGLAGSHNWGGPGMTGGRTGLRWQLLQTGPATTGGNYQCGLFASTGQFSAGGTDVYAGALGTVFGAGIYANLANGATNWAGAAGAEIDFGIYAGATARSMFGLNMVKWASHAYQPEVPERDGMIGFSDGVGSAFGSSYGLQFGGEAQWPIDNTRGKIIAGVLAAAGTTAAAHGVDWNQVTFSGTAFRSRGFSVQPDGTIQTGNLWITSDATNSRIDAKGSTVTAAAIASGGANCVVGQPLLHDATGTVLIVTAVSGGVITGVSLYRAGYAVAPPANPVTFRCRVMGAAQAKPTDPTINLTWTANAALSLQPSGGALGFYGATPLAKQTGVAVTAAGIHAALTALGLIAP